MAAPPPPPRGGMSLYANLLDPKTDSSATISRPPVLFKPAGAGGDGDSTAKRPLDASALRFQPIRRPQQAKSKPKGAPASAFPKTIPGLTPTSSTNTPAASSPAAAPPSQQPQPPRRTLADFAPREEDEYLYGTGEKRQRGGRRKKKKGRQPGGADDRPAETDWDELYDPARPTNVEEYLRSDERIREIVEWKAVLYAHRRRREQQARGSYGGSSENNSEDEAEQRPVIGNQIPPPLSFAPPPSYTAVPPPSFSPGRGTAPSPPPPPPAPPPDDATGDDAYARRLALSGMTAPPPHISQSPPPPPPSAPPPESAATGGATIARAPVRYNAPAAPEKDADSDSDVEMDVDSPSEPPPPARAADDRDGPMGDDDKDRDKDKSDAFTPRSSRPGQAGFAARLMSKYGWTKGTGLGADESGIVNPLRVQVEKRRKRPDAEGGGYAAPGGRGRIVGGNKKKKGDADAEKEGDEKEEEGGKFGPMSAVIVLRNMLEGMPDLAAEVEDGLGQEIGEECGSKYGRVERLYIDMDNRQVFIKFTEPISALRAVNALEGRIFNGNAIVPRFYDADKFEAGVYA